MMSIVTYVTRLTSGNNAVLNRDFYSFVSGIIAVSKLPLNIRNKNNFTCSDLIFIATLFLNFFDSLSVTAGYYVAFGIK